MGVLCDTQIRESVSIEPFAGNEKRPGSVSFGVARYRYDVRVSSHFEIFTNVSPSGGQEGPRPAVAALWDESGGRGVCDIKWG